MTSGENFENSRSTSEDGYFTVSNFIIWIITWSKNTSTKSEKQCQIFGDSEENHQIIGSSLENRQKNRQYIGGSLGNRPNFGGSQENRQ